MSVTLSLMKHLGYLLFHKFKAIKSQVKKEKYKWPCKAPFHHLLFKIQPWRRRWTQNRLNFSHTVAERMVLTASKCILLSEH